MTLSHHCVDGFKPSNELKSALLELNSKLLENIKKEHVVFGCQNLCLDFIGRCVLHLCLCVLYAYQSKKSCKHNHHHENDAEEERRRLHGELSSIAADLPYFNWGTPFNPMKGASQSLRKHSDCVLRFYRRYFAL